MADWSTFFGFVGVILALLLALAHASQSAVSDTTGPTVQPTSTSESDHSVDRTAPAVDPTDALGSVDSEPPAPHPQRSSPNQQAALSTPALLANVALSQGLFAVLLVLFAWYTEIPAWAFGLSAEYISLRAVGTGLVVGGVLYVLNEAMAAVGRRQGIATPTALREALAPESTAGWAVLFVVVLPVIAGFEELLFRGALIGVGHAGFGLSPWLLAVGSSIAFALGHGAQGRLGIVVTGLLGGALAAVFIYTECLVVVIVAHYVVNAMEFVIHEALE